MTASHALRARDRGGQENHHAEETAEDGEISGMENADQEKARGVEF